MLKIAIYLVVIAASDDFTRYVTLMTLLWCHLYYVILTLSRNIIYLSRKCFGRKIHMEKWNSGIFGQITVFGQMTAFGQMTVLGQKYVTIWNFHNEIPPGRKIRMLRNDYVIIYLPCAAFDYIHFFCFEVSSMIAWNLHFIL